jgi:hypothetical protein
MSLAIALLATALLGEERFADHFDPNQMTDGREIARITYVDEGLGIERDGYAEELTHNFPLEAGDFLATRYDGYLEAAFVDGSKLQVDLRTELEFQAIYEQYRQEALTVLRLHEGSIFLHLTPVPRDLASRVFRIDTASGSIYLETPGIYRVDFTVKRMTVKTFRGIAELSGSANSELIRSGEYATISNRVRPSEARPFNSFSSDRFERWAYRRSPQLRSVSRDYVDDSLYSYAAELDDHGSWRYEDECEAHVWVPRVSSDWRPYHAGFWTRSAGRMTWVSHDPFGWVTHHYGRWGWSSRYGWYWIPGRVYSPAWVAWTSYDDYLGWCPLGYWDRPYYYGRHGINVHIQIDLGWMYVRSEHWNHRRAERVRPSRSRDRVITTRPLFVTRSEFGSPREVLRLVREPELNRSRAEERSQRQPVVVERRAVGEEQQDRTPITSRSSGSPNTARLPLSSRSSTPSERETTRERDETTRGQYDGATSGGATSGDTTRGDTTRSDTTREEVTRGSSSSPRTGSSERSGDASHRERDSESTRQSEESEAPRSENPRRVSEDRSSRGVETRREQEPAPRRQSSEVESSRSGRSQAEPAPAEPARRSSPRATQPYQPKENDQPREATPSRSGQSATPKSSSPPKRTSTQSSTPTSTKTGREIEDDQPRRGDD